MTRIFDIIFSIIGIILLSPIFILIIIIALFDTGSPIFYQVRVGISKKPFRLLKFRSMKVNAPSVATHLSNPLLITSFGKILRKTKLDELPQLWNVLRGEMSLVGPRPNLFGMDELILERESYDIYNVRPGITGLAQINKIGMEKPKLLAQTDAYMIENYSIRNYFKYIFLTITGRGSGDFLNSNL